MPAEPKGQKRKADEWKRTRYHAEPPAEPTFEATVTSKGQVTIPKVVRERLGLLSGGKLRFVLKDDHAVIRAEGPRLSDLFGILGKPPRSATLEEMDEAISQAANERFRRAVDEAE